MTNPAEKIRQVVEDANNALRTYEWTAVTDVEETYVVDSDDARKVLKEALAAQLDAIIESIEEDYNNLVQETDDAPSELKYWMEAKIKRLKEARKELSENIE